MPSSIAPVGSPTAILTSALNGYQTEVDVAARNIAQSTVPGADALRALPISTAPGLRVLVEPGGGAIDQGTELVSMMSAADSYKAAAVAMGSIARTEKHAMEIMG